MNQQQKELLELQEMQQRTWRPTWSNLSLGALGGFSTMGLEAAHNPELALLSGVLAVVATWKGDEIINFIESLCSQQGRTELAVKLSRRPYAFAQPEEGKTTHLLTETLQPQEESFFDFDGEDEEVPLSKAPKKDGIFRFSELLDTGFRPTINKIFVGRTMDGKDIFVAAKDLCHVALAGKTGGGKGSLMRLIMVQLCYVGAKVLLLNPHYMRWVSADNGTEFDEDWTPFEGIHPRKNKPYLEMPPVDCADFGPIEQHLAWSVETLLQDRKREGRDGGKKFIPYFIVVDEWPAVTAELKDASSQLAKLLREGRKYGIFVIVASQDFQVKTMGMDGGSVRKCLLTVFYTGGDKTTAKELLNYEKVENVPENNLGKGIVLMRCTGTQNEPVLVRVPFVDNESVYKLLGPSTFKKKVHSNATEVPFQEPDRSVAPDDRTTSVLPETTLPLEQTITLTTAQLMALLNGNTGGNNHPFISQNGSQEMTGNAFPNDMEMASQAEPRKIIDDVFPVYSQPETVHQLSSDIQKSPVSEEKLEMIKRMKEKGFKDKEIATIAGLAGRKYGTYQECLVYLRYRQQEAN